MTVFATVALTDITAMNSGYRGHGNHFRKTHFFCRPKPSQDEGREGRPIEVNYEEHPLITDTALSLLTGIAARDAQSQLG